MPLFARRAASATERTLVYFRMNMYIRPPTRLSSSPTHQSISGRCWTRAYFRDGSFPDFVAVPNDVRFSNRPFGVKRFQTIHHCNVDVARGLVLLFGIGASALPSWDSKTRRNNLLVGLAVNRTAGPSGHTNSPHPSSREGHPSAAWWISSFLLSGLILTVFR